ncbi:hypothetical protein KC323_g2788 [Hortaea werneckii]|nr:hypothetical protein KC323_g2788 [Hortaea werneckii]
MPSLEESRRQVSEGLDRQANDIDHNDILASLQEEIDKHNQVKDHLRDAVRRSHSDRRRGDKERGDRPAKLRFKHSSSDGRKRKHRSKHNASDGRRHSHKRKREYPTPPSDESEAAHPFPREPTDPDGPAPADAFRDSLFDALAHDEGAEYWESVYNQPIHVYPRPTQQNEKGTLEAMDDDQYAEYVKTRMWEKKHPEIVQERERSRRKRREREEERTKAREDFVRRKERAAWEKAERKNARRFGREDENSDDEQYEKTVPPKEWSTEGKSRSAKEREAEYTAAWSHYLAAWDRLKSELLSTSKPASSDAIPLSRRIPWPVLGSKPVIRPNIEAFFHHAPAEDEQMKLRVLKAERMRWHPDKIQQRFGGDVEEGVMKLVTGVFQVVDAVFEAARARMA